MEQYNVRGMSCAACSARVEKAVLGVEGVTSCSVSLLTNSMGVEGTASAQDIIKAVEDAGYSASVKGAEHNAEKTADDPFKDTESPKILKRLIASLIFLAVLMYISMGHSMLGWPMPSFFEGNPIAIGLAQLLLSAIVMVINGKFFISGWKGLVHRAPNMDTLVALGAGTAFIYSTYALFAMTSVHHSGMAEMMHYMHEFYFESSATILTLITVGKLLEARSKGRTTNALKSLMNLSPKTAVILVDGVETEVGIEAVKKDDIFVVRPGESIPVDGVVLDGSTVVDESALTGESVPVDKAQGDSVSAATINRSGFIRCQATRVGEDTTLSQIIKMVSDAAATKAPIAKIADKVSGIFVPAVISIAIITAALWLIFGESIGFSLARAISVLVISCPCALGLATPVAIMVGSGVGARNGILFKSAASLEETGRIKTVALDKTGTITRGEPVVTDILPADVDEMDLLSAASALEAKSEHPLAKAITNYASDNHISFEEITDFQIFAGNGLSGKLNDKELCGGNYNYIKEKCDVPATMKTKAEQLAESGKTPLYFSEGNKLLGIIAVADVIKPDSPDAIAQLKQLGIRVVMLTGDNKRTAAAIGRQSGVDEVIAEVLPDSKAEVIAKLKQKGKTAMVGDGINDAPALTVADTGIAIGAGTDVAIDAADVVLMNSSLSDVPAAIRLGRATLRNIHENLFWAFIYNVIGIPLAAGAFIHLFGWQLNPMFGAAAMSLSSFCVVTNALRLNFARIRPKQSEISALPESNIEIFTESLSEKETNEMNVTINIEGMMCGHCEAHVKTALESLPQVESAEVSHKEGTAKVTLSEEIPFETLKETVEAQGYKVI